MEKFHTATYRKAMENQSPCLVEFLAMGLWLSQCENTPVNLDLR